LRAIAYFYNPNVLLWRIEASRIRAFTHREYARLQTFPDDWVFCGRNKRDIQQQIGNAVPVNFARVLAQNVKQALTSMDERECFSAEKKKRSPETCTQKSPEFVQLSLF
jgi:DNA (cytosine-5)-methyltransferase 1